jgi:hypothetical protein
MILQLFFWHVGWLFECSLKTQYPLLFEEGHFD